MLRNRLPEIEFDDLNPFKNDQFDRKDCANTFCALVKLYSDTGCVISLNGKWGTGKTTFIKMLRKKIKKEGGHSLYFNAWENDYISDPFIALLSELKDLFPKSTKMNNVIAKGGKIITSIGASVLKSISKNKLGVDPDVINTGIDEISELLKKDLEDFSNQKNSFIDFRKALEEYITDNTENEYPIVFFVDELDRCNPRFAVLVLERIKHLFDIPNIIFVLSIDKKQLEYAVQGYYGSANIDASNYLRRFIDIEYFLPQPDGKKFCKYLYETYHFDEVFENQERLRHSEFESDRDSFLSIAEKLISSSNLDLRTTDKIFAHSRVALSGFNLTSYIIPDIFFILCFFRVTNYDLYRNLLNEKLSLQDLLAKLEEYLPTELLKKNNNNVTWRQMTYAIAFLICIYSINENGIERESFLKSNNDVREVFQLKYLDADTSAERLL